MRTMEQLKEAAIEQPAFILLDGPEVTRIACEASELSGQSVEYWRKEIIEGRAMICNIPVKVSKFKPELVKA